MGVAVGVSMSVSVSRVGECACERECVRASESVCVRVVKLAIIKYVGAGTGPVRECCSMRCALAPECRIASPGAITEADGSLYGILCGKLCVIMYGILCSVG